MWSSKQLVSKSVWEWKVKHGKGEICLYCSACLTSFTVPHQWPNGTSSGFCFSEWGHNGQQHYFSSILACLTIKQDIIFREKEICWARRCSTIYGNWNFERKRTKWRFAEEEGSFVEGVFPLKRNWILRCRNWQLILNCNQLVVISVKYIPIGSSQPFLHSLNKSPSFFEEGASSFQWKSLLACSRTLHLSAAKNKILLLNKSLNESFLQYTIRTPSCAPLRTWESSITLKRTWWKSSWASLQPARLLCNQKWLFIERYLACRGKRINLKALKN